MVRVVTVDDIRNLIRKTTLKTFFLRLVDMLERDFRHWHDFKLQSRLATHYPHGVFELMPICDQEYYSFKYVNGHPNNPKENKMTVVALGMLADIESGYPVLLSEMTFLTALRTAAVSALASKYLSIPSKKCMGIIGTGSQSEFQILAHHYLLGTNKVYFYDKDEKAMEKFARNLRSYEIALHPCKNAESVVKSSQHITTATAFKGKFQVINDEWLTKGYHLNAIGGDCPGKTELDPELLHRSKVVVELLDQTKVEGEIQHLERGEIYAELWELIANKKPGRESEDDVTIFDSVGFALEDYSVLRLVYSLAEQYHIGHVLDLVPEVNDPKDLFSLLEV